VQISGLSEIEAFCGRRRSAASDLRSLVHIIQRAEWRNTNDVRRQLGENANIASAKRVRLDMPEHKIAVDIEPDFRAGLVKLRLVELSRR
jgi:mRNA-degrading endonuclease HigB of HigAB toxin-antitoxin module